jgi:hypothetical protein
VIRRDASHAQLRGVIFEWIEGFCNRQRFHRASGFKTPVDFSTQLN